MPRRRASVTTSQQASPASASPTDPTPIDMGSWSVLLQNFAHAVLIEDKQGRVSAYNRAWSILAHEEVFGGLQGQPRSAALAKLSQMLRHPDQALETFKNLAAHEHAFAKLEWATLSGRNLSFTYQPTPFGGIWQIYDITRERRLTLQNRSLNLLRETTLGLLHHMEAEELMENIVTQAGELMNAGSGYIYLVDPDGKHMTMHVGQGKLASLVGIQMNPGEGAGGRAWLSGEPVVIENYEQWDGKPEAFANLDLYSVVAVPLKHGLRTLGVLGLCYEAHANTTNDDLTVLTQFAEMVVLALTNARLVGDLRASEERYRTILSTIEDGYYEVNRAGYFTAANDALLKILGQQESIVGQSFTQFTDEAEMERLSEIFGEVYQTGQQHPLIETHAFRPNNEMRQIEVSVALVHDQDAQPVGFRGIVRDVSDRKRMERDLQMSEERYRAMIESMAEGVVLFNHEGAVTSYNQVAKRILGLKEDVIYSAQAIADHAQMIRNDGSRLPPEDFPVLQTLRTGDAVSNVTMGFAQDGLSPLWLSANSRPLSWRGFKRPHMIIMSFSDITRLKLVEIALNQQVTALAALQLVEDELSRQLDFDYVMQVAVQATLAVSDATAGYLLLMEDGRMRVGRAAGAYDKSLDEPQPIAAFGTTVERVWQTREPMLAIYGDPEGFAPLNQTTRAIMAVPLISHDMLVGVLQLETDEIERFTVDVFNFLRLLAGRIASAVDNARLYRVAQRHLNELQAAYNQISALEQLKTQMIRVAAHDLRTPLGIIAGYVDMIRDELGEKGRKPFIPYFEPIDRAVNRMTDMTTDILSLEKIYTRLELHPIDLVGMIERAHVDFRSVTHQRHQTIKTHFPKKGTKIWIDAEEVQLFQAISNLIGNASKYTPEKGTIELALRTENDKVIFEVQDNGIGIPKEHQEKLFQPFYRVKTEETRRIDGTGLGLYLVKKIIEQHHGTMIFESEHGTGSRFGFQIPLRAAPELPLLTTAGDSY